MQDSMVFYKSFFDAINNVDDREVQLQVYKAIFEFSLLEEEPELDGLAYTLFILIKPQLVANLKRREDGEKGRDYGILGGRPKKKKNPYGVIENKKEKTPMGLNDKTPNVNVNDNIYSRIFDSYNSQKNLINCKSLTKNRIDSIKDLLDAFTEEEIKEVFEKANNTPWLIGKNDKNWKVDFDWLININNFVKVQDGRYDGLSNEKTKPSGIISSDDDDFAAELDRKYGFA